MKNWVKLLVSIVAVIICFKLFNQKTLKDEIVVNSNVKDRKTRWNDGLGVLSG